jgi:phytoene dehydrogenase-like protein
LFVQHVPNDMGDAYWNQERENFADRVFALVDEVAPGFSSYVIHREILAPSDLERIFAITGGNIFHGAMTPDRLWFMRPTPAASGYRMPLPGLYLCGAGVHPGGGVMGACGRNAAKLILHDLV